jgi:GNAT superfamily N-acetyltransferase
MKYKIDTLINNKEYGKKHRNITKDVWTKVMQNSKVADKCWPKLEKYFPEYQIYFISDENEVMGFSNTIPFFWDKKLELLPDEGWDWLIQKGISDYENKVTPNCLGGLQVAVAKEYQRQGLSKIIINTAKELSKKKNFKFFIIPIRPTLKHKYPLIDMENYIKWTKDGRVFDPWIRAHIDCGAKIIKVCRKSMTYTGTVKEWEEWSGLEIIDSGKYIVEGIVNPVKIDIEEDCGVYYDENIWIYYS